MHSTVIDGFGAATALSGRGGNSPVPARCDHADLPYSRPPITRRPDGRLSLSAGSPGEPSAPAASPEASPARLHARWSPPVQLARPTRNAACSRALRAGSLTRGQAALCYACPGAARAAEGWRWKLDSWIWKVMHCASFDVCTEGWGCCTEL